LIVKFSGAAQEQHRRCIGAAQALPALNIGITQAAGGGKYRELKVIQTWFNSKYCIVIIFYC
jgi:hypothetical protein